MMSCGSVDGDVIIIIIIIDVPVWTASSVFYGLGAKGRELSSGDRRLLSVFSFPTNYCPTSTVFLMFRSTNRWIPV
jgi:hypothetical protein